MRELAELDQLIDHVCANPRVQRLMVYEPVSERWQWLSVFDCCSQVFCEPAPNQEALVHNPPPVPCRTHIWRRNKVLRIVQLPPQQASPEPNRQGASH